MTKSTKKKKGDALVVAMLLSAIIGSAAIGLTAIAFRQVNIAETYNNGLAAYYAAESGIEQGLLYYKFDKTVEIPKKIDTTYFNDPAKLLRRPANSYRNFMDQAIMRQPSGVDDASNVGVKVGFNGNDKVQTYDLQTYYKQAFNGDDPKDPRGELTALDLADYAGSTAYKITRDNEMVFTINSDPADKTVNQIYLYWKWIAPCVSADCINNSRALEVKLKVKEVSPSGQDEYTMLFQDPRTLRVPRAELPVEVSGLTGVFTPLSGKSLQEAMHITAFTVTEMTLKPVGNTAGSEDGIYFGFSQSPAGAPARNTSGLTTTIQSIGYYVGNSRQIVATVDRQTGTILDIFNYVIYKGGN